MAKTKTEKLKEVEDEKKATRTALIQGLEQSINQSIDNFKTLPAELKRDRDVVKIAFQKVGAAVWFSTDGLTK